MPENDFPEHECLFTLVRFEVRYCIVCLTMHPDDDPTGMEAESVGPDRDAELQYRGAV